MTPAPRPAARNGGWAGVGGGAQPSGKPEGIFCCGAGRSLRACGTRCMVMSCSSVEGKRVSRRWRTKPNKNPRA